MTTFFSALQSSFQHYVYSNDGEMKKQSTNQSVNQSAKRGRPAPIITDTDQPLYMPITPPLTSPLSQSNFGPCEYAKFGCTALVDRSNDKSVDAHNNSDFNDHLELIKSSFRTESTKVAHTRIALTQAQSRSRKSDEIIHKLTQSINESTNQIQTLNQQLIESRAHIEHLEATLKQLEDRPSIDDLLAENRSQADYIARLEEQMGMLLSVNQSLVLAQSSTNQSTSHQTSGPEGFPHAHSTHPFRGHFSRRASDFKMPQSTNQSTNQKHPLPRPASASPVMHKQTHNRATITGVFLSSGNVMRHGPSPQMVGAVGNLTLGENGLDLSINQSINQSNNQSSDDDDDNQPGLASSEPSICQSRWRRPDKQLGEQSVGQVLGMEYACPVVLVKKVVGALAPQNMTNEEHERNLMVD